jgi:redox-sensitive bicupin YhaK (pirin superfamily)
VARGAVHLDDVALREGDGAAVTGRDRVAIQGDGDAEVLVFDLSMRH